MILNPQNCDCLVHLTTGSPTALQHLPTFLLLQFIILESNCTTQISGLIAFSNLQQKARLVVNANCISEKWQNTELTCC